MLQYLWNETNKSYKLRTYPKLEYVKHIFNSYIIYIKNYYGNNDRYVKRPNKLVTLIESLSIDISKSNTDVFIDLDINSKYITNTLGFITNINKNTDSFSNTIIDKNNEYIIINNDSFNYLSKDDCVSSLKCIYHDSDNVLLAHPKVISLSDKTFIYTLNATKLGMSYYYWSKEQLMLDKDVDVARFVFEITLTEVIDSLLDVSLFNRYINLSNNSPVSDFINFNVFNLPDVSKYIDKAYIWVLKHYKNTNITYEEYLINIPLYSSNALDFIQLPYIQSDKRNKWIFYMSRFYYILHLLNHVDNKRNKDSLNILLKSITYDNNSKIFSIDKKLDNYFKNNLSKINKLI